MVRILPGSYVSLNDLSQVPEGQSALTVGYVVQANRGPIGELGYVTSPTNYLTKYTFGGKPSITDDKTHFSILKVLSKTNSMYISRAANNPLYGGYVAKAPVNISLTETPSYTLYILTASVATSTSNANIVVSGDATSVISVADTIMVKGSTSADGYIDGYYKVLNVSTSTGEDTTVIEIEGDLAENFTATSTSKATISIAPGTGISEQKIGTVSGFTASAAGVLGIINISQDKETQFPENSTFTIKGCSVEANNKSYTVSSAEYKEDQGVTQVKVKEEVSAVASGNKGNAYYKDLVSPSNYAFGSDDLFLITGKDQGAYNSDIGISIVSSIDDTSMVYHKGADIGGKECTFDTIELTVKNVNTGETLETFLFSRDRDAKTIDGISLYIDEVVKNSAYIQVLNHENNDGTSYNSDVLPISSVEGINQHLTGGSDGGTVTVENLVAAIQPFKDKTVSISLLGNGCSPLAETRTFQQALMEVAEDRKDLMVFLNSPREREQLTIPSDRAVSIVDYKKSDLGNTSFYGCMYAPHVNYSDIYNGTTVKIGSEAVALAGWLDVINNLNYPYAYAGPKNGLVQGVTCDWKIGDTSGEAQLMNDASVNYIAFDGKVGRYYMQCQNTLQVANSAMRNIGTVLNVLDIKEHFVVLLKEFIQLPITDDLRRDILDVSRDYLNPMLGVRFYNYSFTDVTTAIDIADNTLRYLLVIAPTMYAQKIYLVMNVVNATFDFSIVQAA